MGPEDWLDEVECAVDRGDWNRALRLLRRVENGPASPPGAGTDRDLRRRLENILDRAAVRQTRLTDELTKVQRTRRSLRAMAVHPIGRRQVDQRL